MEELVLSYDEMVLTRTLLEYLKLSEQIGGLVQEQAKFVRQAFQAQRNLIELASKYNKPKHETDVQKLLKPTADQILQAQGIMESNRRSEFFHHLSAVAEAITSLGWVLCPGNPSNFVKELHGAGAYYGNKVIVANKDKNQTHVNWAKAWLQVIVDLRDYIFENHKTGLRWNPKGPIAEPGIGEGSLTPGPPGPPPPPPPPPPLEIDDKMQNLSTEQDARALLFAEINQGANITRCLKSVDKSCQQKSPAHSLSSQSSMKNVSTTQSKPPRMECDGRKWCVEYQQKAELKLTETSMNQSVCIFQCHNCVIYVENKVNCITLDSCKKTSIVFSDIVSFVEFINCQDVKAQAMASVPTITADKTDGLQIYLGEKSIGTDIVSSKCSELNICVPTDDGDFREFAVPEQFRTTALKSGIKTVVVEKM